jgi:hypothetical protein
MLSGIMRTADISACGSYRWTLSRTWDDRPALLVVMFNPSTANAETDDNTINLLCHVATHNGYGGIMVVNGIPLRSSTPGPALKMLEWADNADWVARDLLNTNLELILEHVEDAGAVLIAWGALANRTVQSRSWFTSLLANIDNSCQDKSRLLCLSKTGSGQPLHPAARAKQKVAKNAILVPWSANDH